MKQQWFAITTQDIQLSSLPDIVSSLNLLLQLLHHVFIRFDGPKSNSRVLLRIRKDVISETRRNLEAALHGRGR